MNDPKPWTEVVDELAHTTALSHREAQRYVEVLRAHDHWPPEDAADKIVQWHACGVSPELLAHALKALDKDGFDKQINAYGVAPGLRQRMVAERTDLVANRRERRADQHDRDLKHKRRRLVEPRGYTRLARLLRRTIR